MFCLRQQHSQHPCTNHDHGADVERRTDDITGVVPKHVLWRHLRYVELV